MKVKVILRKQEAYNGTYWTAQPMNLTAPPVALAGGADAIDPENPNEALIRDALMESLGRDGGFLVAKGDLVYEMDL